MAIDRAAGHICTDIINAGRDTPVVIRNLEATSYAKTDPAVDQLQLRTYIGFAVRRQNRPVGSLCALFRSDREFHADDLQILGIIAAALAVEEERQYTAEEIRKQEFQYRSTVDGLLDWLHVVDRDLRIILINDSMRAMLHKLGIATDNIVGRSLFEVHTFLKEKVRQEYEKVFASGRVISSLEETQIGNEVYHTETRKIPIVENGRVERIIMLIHDITERIRREKVQSAVYRISEAANSAPSLQELFRSIHLILGTLMPARNFYIALSDPQKETLHFPYFVDQFDEPPPPRERGRGLTEYVLRKGSALLATPQVFRELLESGEVEEVGAPALDWMGVPLKSGSLVFGVMVVQTYEESVRYRPDDMEIMNYVSEQVAMAIQRKRTEDELQRREAQFRAIFEEAGVGIVLADVRTNALLRWNAAYRDMLGYGDTELAGLTNEQVTHPEDLEKEKKSYLDVLQGRANQFELEKRFLRKDGRISWGRQTSTFVRDADQNLVFAIAMIEDITEKRQLEEQIRQAQKMETIGRLAGGIAHDFNNLLAGIIGYADLLKENLKADPVLSRFAQTVLETADRAAGLTRQLLSFSRKGKMAKEAVDIHQVVAERHGTRAFGGLRDRQGAWRRHPGPQPAGVRHPGRNPAAAGDR